MKLVIYKTEIGHLQNQNWSFTKPKREFQWKIIFLILTTAYKNTNKTKQKNNAIYIFAHKNDIIIRKRK